MQKQIVVTVDADGATTIDAVGFKGSSCVKATEQLEIVLGGGLQGKRTKKPEFHAPAGAKINNNLAF